MTATMFALMDPFNGRLAGVGVICPEARYCSVKQKGGDRIERRFLSLADWRQVEGENRDHVPAAPLEPESAMARALNGQNRWVIQYVSALPIDAAPAAVPGVLDAYLLSGDVRPPDVS